MKLRQVRVRTEQGTTFVMDGKKTSITPKYSMGKFHCWEHFQNGKNSCVRAIVELEDGTVRIFDVNDIKFIDNLTKTMIPITTI